MAASLLAKRRFFFRTCREFYLVWLLIALIWLGRDYLGTDLLRSSFKQQPFLVDESLAESRSSSQAYDPLSPARPQRQFVQQVPRRALVEPVFALGSIAGPDDSDKLTATYRSIAQGSMSNWHWLVILNSQSARSNRTFENTVKRDRRVELIDGSKGSLATASMSEQANYLIDRFYATKARYGAFLVPGVLLEPTILEKSAWALESTSQWDLVGHFWRHATEKSTVIQTGLHSGAGNLKKNLIADATVFRLETARTLRCQTRFVGNALDLWSFWLCFASAGKWGGTIPETGSWIGSSSRKTLGSIASYPSLSQSNFPRVTIPKSVALEPITWLPPFRNQLVTTGKKSIMIVQGWLLVGGSELGFLDVLRFFASRGYRVTMVLTRSKFPLGMALHDQVARYTNDIHYLPAHLRMRDFPRYIEYLVHTRGVSAVMMTNSQLIYEILPALAERMPDVLWVDYLHNEGYDGWKSDGFPSFSFISQRYLSRTLTCSEHLRDWLIERGANPDRVGVAKLGLQTDRFDFVDEEERQVTKKTVLGIDPDVFVAVSSARFDTQKRPWLVPKIIQAARLRKPASCPASDISMIMMGDGQLRDAVRDLIRDDRLEQNVFLYGTVDQPGTILRGSDAFLLPSAIEGISIAVAEAMAIGLPIITTNAGGLPEQLGEQTNGTAIAGRLITRHATEDEDVSDYANALVEMACNPAKRQAVGRAARKHVLETFDQKNTLLAFESELEIARKAGHADPKLTPNPAVYYGLQDMGLEDYPMVDLAATQKQLSKAKSSGKVGELEDKCYLEGKWAVPWLNAVSKGTLCGSTLAADNNWLFRAGREQCGAWCVWDLRSTKPVGWRFDGKCFTRFDSPSEMPAIQCAEWFHQRPAIHFVDRDTNSLTALSNKVVAR